MKNATKLVVESLGRIAHAEILPRALTLFLGENNTGKSYLATLLWALQQPDVSKLLLESGRDLDSFRACEATIDRWLSEGQDVLEPTSFHPVTDEDTAVFTRWLLEAMDLAKDAIVRDAFNDHRMTVGHLSFVGRSESIRMVVLRQFDDRPAQVSLSGPRGGGFTTSLANPEHRANSIPVLALLLAGFFEIGSFFLPASRTGFMLLYKAQLVQLVEGLLMKTPQERPRRPDLTKPAIRFLQRLASGFNPGEGLYAEEARLIENGLRGELIVQTGTGTPEYLYRYHDREPPLTMALSSSMVTELAPIVFALRDPFPTRWLFIEEPEAHLHPAMQRLLAQAVTRLVRKGMRLCLTTHSENFCQQLNNFIKIGAAADRNGLQARFGYSALDYLLPEEAVGYQFVTEGERTSVREVAASEHGLVMPTFNETLVDLSRQTLELEAALVTPAEPRK